jgi:hypothetical protein
MSKYLYKPIFCHTSKNMFAKFAKHIDEQSFNVNKSFVATVNELFKQVEYYEDVLGFPRHLITSVGWKSTYLSWYYDIIIFYVTDDQHLAACQPIENMDDKYLTLSKEPFTNWYLETIKKRELKQRDKQQMSQRKASSTTEKSPIGQVHASTHAVPDQQHLIVPKLSPIVEDVSKTQHDSSLPKLSITEAMDKESKLLSIDMSPKPLQHMTADKGFDSNVCSTGVPKKSNTSGGALDKPRPSTEKHKASPTKKVTPVTKVHKGLFKPQRTEAKSIGVPRTIGAAMKFVLAIPCRTSVREAIGKFNRSQSALKDRSKDRKVIISTFNALLLSYSFNIRNRVWKDDKRTVGLYRFVRDLILQLTTRGMPGVVQWAKALSQDAEKALLGDTIPTLWNQYYTGIHRGILHSQQSLALLATFARSIPPFSNKKMSLRAFKKAVSAWTKPTSKSQTITQDTEKTRRLRDLRTRRVSFLRHKSAHNYYHPSRIYPDGHFLHRLATKGITIDELLSVRYGRYHMACLRKESYLKDLKEYEELVEIYNKNIAPAKIETMIHNDIEIQRLDRKILLSQEKVTVRDIDQADLASIEAFVLKTFKQLNTNSASRQIPIMKYNYLSNAACFENSRAKGGGYKYLFDKMNEYVVQAPRRRDHLGRLVVDFTDNKLHPLYRFWKDTSEEEMWSRLIKNLRKDPAKAKITVIPEKGGKFRVANVTDIATIAHSQPLGDQVIKLLQRHPALKGAYSDDHTYNAQRLFDNKHKNLVRRFYSTDMNQSTDTLDKDCIYAVIRGLAKALNWTREQFNDAIRTVTPMNLYDEHNKLIGQNINGTLLGIPLSFAILCSIHLWCVEGMSKSGIRRTVVYGDDMATYCTNEDWRAYQNRCLSVGFTLNLTKTHVSDLGFTFCGKIYKIFGEHVQWVRASKLSIVTGASGTKKDWQTKLSQVAQASHLVKSWQASRLKDKYITSNRKVYNVFARNGIPLQGELCNGGLGFKGRSTLAQRKIAVMRGISMDLDPFAHIWDTYTMPSHMKHACKQAYTTFNKELDVQPRHRGEPLSELLRRNIKDNPIFYKKGSNHHKMRYQDAVSTYLVTAVHNASLSVDKYKFKEPTTKGPTLVARQIQKKIKSMVSLYNIECTEKGSLPPSPSPRYVSKALSNLRRTIWLDGEVVEEILNRLPSRHTIDDHKVPNFKLENYIRRINSRTDGYSRTVHRVLRIKT